MNRLVFEKFFIMARKTGFEPAFSGSFELHRASEAELRRARHDGGCEAVRRKRCVASDHGRVAATGRHGQVTGRVDGVHVSHPGAEGGDRLDLLLHDDILVFLERATFLGSTVLEPNFYLELK